jgi:hypothetical protein
VTPEREEINRLLKTLDDTRKALDAERDGRRKAIEMWKAERDAKEKKLLKAYADARHLQGERLAAERSLDAERERRIGSEKLRMEMYRKETVDGMLEEAKKQLDAALKRAEALRVAVEALRRKHCEGYEVNWNAELTALAGDAEGKAGGECGACKAMAADRRKIIPLPMHTCAKGQPAREAGEENLGGG